MVIFNSYVSLPEGRLKQPSRSVFAFVTDFLVFAFGIGSWDWVWQIGQLGGESPVKR